MHVLRASMELGGNAPVLVFDDADVNRAVDEAVVAKRRNGGQSCVAANRILVHEAVAGELIVRFTDRIAPAVVGSGTAPRTEVGPLIDGGAVAKVQELVDDAVSRGARVLSSTQAVVRAVQRASRSTRS